MIYLDSSYLVRLYIDEPGYEAVRRLASRHSVACCAIGSAEVVGAMHRKLREGAVSRATFRTTFQEFERHLDEGAFRWLPLTTEVEHRVQRVYKNLPSHMFLRAADAIHLACAVENYFDEIYSNDLRFLAAAPYFSLQGINVIT